jgi:tRNA A37 threonylcarbamoyladenosine biosynthesis protein TsaE
LSGAEEILQAGLEDYLYPRDAVAVVEWAERWLGESPAAAVQGLEHLRRVWMEMKSEQIREIRYEDFGT